MLSYQMDKVEKALTKYGDSLMRIAYSYSQNMEDAQDIVQDVFLKYITKLPQFASDEHEKAWLIRVAINICKNHLASAYRKKRAELSEDISVADTYSSGLMDAVNSLPPKYRIVIHLYYYEGYSQKEIAKIINLTESAVATRLQRGRNLLKTKIGDDFFE
ncbi:MAG: RNA polymerase sigma factor [Ruminococcus sp.]